MLPDLVELPPPLRREVVSGVVAALTGTVVLAHPAALIEPTQGVAFILDEDLPWGRVYLLDGKAILEAAAAEQAS